jgi:hypothetical protein
LLGEKYIEKKCVLLTQICQLGPSQKSSGKLRQIQNAVTTVVYFLVNKLDDDLGKMRRWRRTK